MEITKQAQRLGEALTEYMDLLAELRQAEAKADKLVQETNWRMRDEKTQDAERVKSLERQCADSPRLELQRILEQLENTTDPDSGTGFWMRQYHGGKAIMHKDERKRLEQRKRELEKEIAFAPLTDAEIEIGSLRRKAYGPTEAEKKAAAASSNALNEASSLLKAARDELREALADLDEILKPVRQQLSLDGITLIERGYEASLRGSEQIARWN